ncbi:hypothetical protein Q5Y75_22415 [Ruegeria sp. 2205SS24-7]|uniref:hypothetical protein n=1 Tax=Ruegeria discodermiae TaxID=3064389 RepID=UPI0027428ED6|nr:hypothetical protein [Ruegeria sp. 2205SS24-7]MDP5219968.1 hypothetical protein [Ruegeria sp. 2205SS24-7]
MMTFGEANGAVIDASMLDMIQREKDLALSAREWEFRLAGMGYAIKAMRGKQVLTKLPQGTVVGILPENLH